MHEPSRREKRRSLINEQALLDAARAQDEDAVMALIERCEAQIAAALAAAGIFSTDPAFDDARNQALLAIWQQFPNYRGEALPCTWMYRIARRLSVSRIIEPEIRERRRRDKLQSHTVTSIGIAPPDHDVEDRDLLSLVWAELSEEDCEILTLRLVLELSIRDIATQLYLSESGAKVRIHRAKKRIVAVARQLGVES